MMKVLFKSILVINLLFPIHLKAQELKISNYFDKNDTTQVHVLETDDGDLFRGRVVDMKNQKIFFLANWNVPIIFEFVEVVSIKVEGKNKIAIKDYRKYEVPEPQSILYHSTAFGLDKGEIIYNNVDLFWNSVDVGVGKGFSVGLEFLLPVLYDAKVEYTRLLSDKLSVGLSVNAYTFFYDIFYDVSDKESGVYLYGMATLGASKLYLNITAGFLRPIFQDDYKYGWNNYVSSFSFGGMLGKHFSYQSEIMINRTRYWDGEVYINLQPSFVLGWQGRVSRFDIGLISLPDSYFEIIPYLSYKIKF